MMCFCLKTKNWCFPFLGGWSCFFCWRSIFPWFCSTADVEKESAHLPSAPVSAWTNPAPIKRCLASRHPPRYKVLSKRCAHFPLGHKAETSRQNVRCCPVLVGKCFKIVSHPKISKKRAISLSKSAVGKVAVCRFLGIFLGISGGDIWSK